MRGLFRMDWLHLGNSNMQIINEIKIVEQGDGKTANNKYDRKQSDASSVVDLLTTA
jgi:hypothetical protein